MLEGPLNGLQEHVFCLKNSITDFRHQSGKLYIVFLDLADAFGSINHEMMVDDLRAYGYIEIIINLTKNIFIDSTFQVDTNSGLTDPIVRHRGIIQGCPYRVIAFEQGIDIWLRWLCNDMQPSIPNKVQEHVDDIVLATTDEASMVEMGSKPEDFLDHSGMKIKHRKCAILHGQRSGNNEIQGYEIPKLGKSGTYQYLGHDISLDGKSNQSQVTDIFTSLSQILDKIDSSVLHIVAKLEAINIMFMSKLNFYLSNVTMSLSQLTVLEDEIVKFIRSWFGLNNSSNRDIMFIPRKFGGLGVINPTTTYIAKKISFLLSTLNSDDPQTRHSARSSLELHMKKT